MIRLEKVTKIYPGSEVPAVDNLDLDIQEGEICILVGPSGCGKTTTMKMINRLIEPTSGRILVNGQDTSEVNPIELRRNIGYVIQHIGLFPHMTIADNIATVPRELGWPKDRIRARVDELLHLVGLEPEIYRNRKPRDLSGGQQQRVGVARAMAADPPVLLMDEPFGALDPITRARLQNEFLRIQAEIKKTIVFVTHDMDEAIKMGNRIAVMRRGRLVQYASPAEILSEPANEFVENLVGGNRSVKRLNLIRAAEVMETDLKRVTAGDSLDAARAVVDRGKGPVFVVDGGGRLVGILSRGELRKGTLGGTAGDAASPIENAVTPDATLHDALSDMLTHGEGYVAVIEKDGRLVGQVTLGDLIEAVSQDED